MSTMLPVVLDSKPYEAERLHSYIEGLSQVDRFGFAVNAKAKPRFARAVQQYFNQMALSAHVDRATSLFVIEKDLRPPYGHSSDRIFSGRASTVKGHIAIVPALFDDGSAIAFKDINGATMIISVMEAYWAVEFIDIHKTASSSSVPMYFCQGYTAITRVLAQGFTPTCKVRLDWDPTQYDFKLPFRVSIGSSIDVEVED